MLRTAAVALAALSLAACASVPNALDVQTRHSLFVKDATIAWTAPLKADPKPEYVAARDEFKAKLEAAVEQAFVGSPAGSQPVRFDIQVKTYNRVGAAMGNLIGGSNAVIADVSVVRESDGRVLGVYKDVLGMHGANGGIIGLAVQAATKPDIEGIMANNFAQNLRTRFDAKS
jgi:hypothetical protein